MADATNKRWCGFPDSIREPIADLLPRRWKTEYGLCWCVARGGPESCPARSIFGQHCRVVRGRCGGVRHLEFASSDGRVPEAVRIVLGLQCCAIRVLRCERGLELRGSLQVCDSFLPPLSRR